MRKIATNYYLYTLGGTFMFLLFFGCSKKVSEEIELTYQKNPVNVQIDYSRMGVGPCEPSICIDPSNPSRIVAGSILNRVHISQDGGKTWKNSKLTSPFGVYGDPVVRIGPKGNIYYSHLSNPTGRAYASEEFLDRIVVQKSTDGGSTFNDGTSPANDRTKDQDKQWLYIDPVDGTVLMSWTEFDKYNSKKATDQSRILFSMSKDEAKTWSTPVDISDVDGDCIDDDDTTEGAVPVQDAEGNIYVAWAHGSKIYLDKSSDGGKTWLPNDIEVADQFGGWTLTIPGINRCNGMPILGIDRSGGKRDGNLYINWSDQKNGESDTDIWLVRSEDGGKTWTDRIRVNDDAPGKHQFFSWMDVDPITGYIYIVFYDRREYVNNETDVYLAYSTDGGRTFTNERISESPFVPNDAIFFGDYNDISAHNGMIRPIWTRLDKNTLSVWTALIDMK
ncbi:MAG: sialidase family protein [Saprospiraceae bacterium]|nr:sialidase family protein [Saprospiraceae bacterium]